jgi:hypothetical protein
LSVLLRWIFDVLIFRQQRYRRSLDLGRKVRVPQGHLHIGVSHQLPYRIQVNAAHYQL